MTSTDNVFKEALTLRPSEKAQLIDKLLSSLDKPDKDIDELWAREAEDRNTSGVESILKRYFLKMTGGKDDRSRARRRCLRARHE